MFSEQFFLEFSGLHCCLFVKVLCCISRRNSDIISCVLSFVNNFFIFFWDLSISFAPLFRGEFYNSTAFSICQHAFPYFFIILFLFLSACRKCILQTLYAVVILCSNPFFMSFFYIMMPGSKGLNPRELAHIFLYK